MAERPCNERRQVRCALGAMAAGAMGLTPAWATASEASGLVSLDWTAPDTCPDAAYVEREVERLLAGATDARGPLLRAQAKVRQAGPASWNMDLETAGPLGAGQRSLTAESCRALADAAALIVALAVDPGRVAWNRAAASDAPAPQQTAPAPVPAPPPGPRAEASPAPKLPWSATSGTSTSSRSFLVAAAASGVVDLGTLPTAAAGAALSLGVIPVRAPSWRFELIAAAFVDQDKATPPSRSATFALRTFDTGVCAVSRPARLELGVCASAGAAWLSAAGLYESVTSHGDAVFAVVRARATAKVALSRLSRGVLPTARALAPFASVWAVRAEVGVGINISRPELSSTGADPGLIHQPARYIGRGALGLELEF